MHSLFSGCKSRVIPAPGFERLVNMRVVVHEEHLALDIPSGHFYHEIAKALDKRRWLPARRMWVFPRIKSLLDFVRQNMPQLRWEQEAEIIWQRMCQEEEDRKRVAQGLVDVGDQLDGVPFVFPPYEHQRKALVLGRNRRVFAYLMDQGTGKTKVIIDDSAHNWREGRIDAVLILAPNSVKTNWCNGYDGDDPDIEIDEVRKHMAPDIPYMRAAYFANPTKEQKAKYDELIRNIPNKHKLLILSMNVEGLHALKAKQVADLFTRRRRCMIVVDESTRIGNHNSQRTKIAMEIRKQCQLARIASGTPVIKSPLKAYSQFNFLDPSIINIATYTEFAARHAIMRKVERDSGRSAEFSVRYINLDELANKIAGVSFRVLKEQCLDLPEKTYTKRNIYMTKPMEVAYREMRENSIIYLNSLEKVEATTVLTQMLRLQQITAGYLPVIDPDTNQQIGIHPLCNDSPPKISEAISMIEELEGKVIVWCKFKFEIAEMKRACDAAGISAVTFFGETSESDRMEARSRFKNDPTLRVFIGQVRTGGIGLTLLGDSSSAETACSNAIYLSNTFSTEDRVQSEDRNHRIGQKFPCTYYDLVTPDTVDVKILNVLRSNKMLSDEVMRDGFRKWI